MSAEQAPPLPSAPPGARWKAVLRGLVTLGLLGLAVRWVDGAAVLGALGSMGLPSLAVVGLLTVGSGVLSAVRWHRVLVRMGERVSLRDAIGDTFVGMTYNVILPTSVGGDVVRAWRCGRRLADREHAWASVVFERLVGLLVLVAMSLVGLAAVANPATRQLTVAAGALVVILTLALLVAPAALRWAARRGAAGGSAPPPGSLAGRLARMASALSGPLSTPGARLETVFWSLVLQFESLSVLLAAGWRWNEPQLALGVYLGIPVALVGSALPVSLGGLGLREALFVVVLAPFGLSAERALALGMVWLASVLMVALIGALVLLGERA